MANSVLYLSYDGMTDPLGQAQVLPYLFGLAKKGVKIHLISFEKAAKSADREIIQKQCAEHGVVWHPKEYTKKPPLISTLKDVYQMRKLAKRLHKEINFDIVHCRSYVAALTGSYLQKHVGLKFVFDMRGFWADERIEGGIWSLRNPLFKACYQYFKQKEIQFFNQADAIISLTEAGKQEIISWPNYTNPKEIVVIPCCVDVSLFDRKRISATKQQELKARLHIHPNDFVLGYVGSIGTWYMLDEMLDYYAVLRTKKVQAKFFFLSGEKKESIHEKCIAKGIPLEEVIVEKAIHSEVPSYLSLFDASIFFIRPTFSKKASSPTKQGELMSMGIPILCNAGVGDTDYIIEKYKAGIVIDTLQKETYQSIELIPSNFDSVQIREGAMSWYSLSEGVNKYYQVYQNLMM